MYLKAALSFVGVGTMGSLCLWLGAHPPLNRRFIGRGEVQAHQIALPNNRAVSLAVDQHEINIVIAVIKPDGTALEIGDSGPYGREAFLLVAEPPGTYTVQLRADRRGPSRGDYDLTVSQLRPIQVSDRQTMTAQTLLAEAGREAETPEAKAYQRSIILYGKAADLYRVAGDLRGEANALGDQGVLHQRNALWTEANQNFLRALTLWDRIGDEYGRLETLQRIGRLRGHFKEQPQFVPSDSELLTRWEALGDRRGIAHMLSSAAGGCVRRGDDQGAIEFGLRANKILLALGDRDSRARLLPVFVEPLLNRGQPDRALLVAQEKLHIHQQSGDKRGEAAALGGVGKVLGHIGRYTEAISYLRQELRLREEQGDLSAAAFLHFALSGLHRKAGDLAAAVNEAEAAVRLGEKIGSSLPESRRLGYFGGQSFSHAYVQALMDAGRTSDAFLAADRALGRLFLKAPALALDEITQILGSEDLLLEYWPGPDEGYLWAVTRNGISSHRLPPLKQLESLARVVYGGFSGRQAPDYSAAALELSRILLGPLADQIRGKRLLIVGEGVLSYLPFSALPNPTRHDGAPMVFDHEIANLPSAAALVTLRRAHDKRRPASKLLALLADPVFDSQDQRLRSNLAVPRLDSDLVRAATGAGLEITNGGLPRLAYAERESRSILRLVPSASVTAFRGVEATREALLSNAIRQHKILHIATHGFSNEDPDLSGLVLSLVDRNGRPVDGFFRLRDLHQLRLDADLVVLSACRTALGRENRGEGIIGLTGGFLRSGAASALSSAWSVNDEATAELMALFYRNLLASKPMGPAASLRAAQIVLASNPRWRSPYYWAGFLLYGEWR